MSRVSRAADASASSRAASRTRPIGSIRRAASYVLRRKPPGKLLPGAHAVEREYRVLAALGGAGFPVPRVYGLCEDEGVIGTPFYVMDMVEGRIVWEAHFPGLSREERAAHFDAMNATIARLHGFDPEALGLGDYGQASGFVERQVARWSKQYQTDVEARPSAGDGPCRRLAGTASPARQRQVARRPWRLSLRQYDLRGQRAQVIAVLDWELSTLGDPVADFTYHLLMYRMPAGCSRACRHGPRGARHPVRRGICRRLLPAHRPRRPANVDYLVVFCLFRLAAIIHGIKGRLARGNASSAHAAQMVERLEPLAELAWSQAEAAQL